VRPRRCGAPPHAAPLGAAPRALHPPFFSRSYERTRARRGARSGAAAMPLITLDVPPRCVHHACGAALLGTASFEAGMR
jgi:hypothetical protein